MKLFANLRGSTTAEALAKVHSDLVQQQQTMQSQLTDLKRGLAAAAFEQPDAVDGMRTQISSLASDLELLEGVVEEAARRHKEAIEREAEETARTALDGVRRKVDGLEQDFIELDKHLDAIDAILDRANAILMEASDANRQHDAEPALAGHVPGKNIALRVKTPATHLGHLKAPLAQVRNHGVLKWFVTRRGSGQASA